MRAVGITRFGGPEVLEAVELPEPHPGEGEVRIRVAAGAVNPTDTGLRAGRRADALADIPPPHIPGMELAGVVDEVGPGASWRPGDRVMAIVLPTRRAGGAQAELVVVPADSVAPVPEGSSLEEAATLPMNGLTAQRAIDLLALTKGQTIGVTGSAGAVGGYVIQLAVSEGLRVIGDAGPKDEALVKQLGADVIVPRGEGSAEAMREASGGGVDGLVDTALMGPKILPAIRDGGKLACVRPFGGDSERGIDVLQVQVSEYAHNQAALERLGRLVGEGKLTLRVARSFPPERAAEAHRQLEAGGTRGRLLIVF
jgi:NADPH:quinone reductase-like Zn-dependent oxidoreductase